MTLIALAALSFRLSAAEVLLRETSQCVVLKPVHSNDPDDPNKSYSKYTPAASFEFTLTNSDAFGFLQPGMIYDIVMVPATGDNLIQVVPKVPLVADTSDDAGTVPLAPAAPAEGAGSDLAFTGDLTPPAPAPASDTPVIDAAAAAIAAAAPAPTAAPAPEAPATPAA